MIYYNFFLFRWKTAEKFLSSVSSNLDLKNSNVPKFDKYPRKDIQPSQKILNENVFYSQSVYDFRAKRLQKN